MVIARTKSTTNIYKVSAMLTNQIGDLVFVRGPMNGFYKVDKCDPHVNTKMLAFAVIIEKWNFTEALVQTLGEIKNIYTGLIPRERYFVGSDGRPTNIPPTPALGSTVLVQPIGIALDDEVLQLVPSPTAHRLRG